MIVKRNHRIFITGTNTDVGKTFIGLNLVRLAIKKGLKIIPFKPIETGCRIIKSKLVPDDSYRYYKLLDYFSRFTDMRMGVILGVMNLKDIFAMIQISLHQIMQMRF